MCNDYFLFLCKMQVHVCLYVILLFSVITYSVLRLPPVANLLSTYSFNLCKHISSICSNRTAINVVVVIVIIVVAFVLVDTAIVVVIVVVLTAFR